MELSRREREILARFENEFTKKETDMAAALDAGPARRLRYSPTLRIWLGLLATLGIGLAVILLCVALFDIGPVGLGALTSTVAALWIVLASSRLRQGNTRESTNQ